MKNLLLIIITIVSFIGCKNKDVEPRQLEGIWINVENEADTLTFTDKFFGVGTAIGRQDKCVLYGYRYNLDKDKITIQYSGCLFINVLEKKFEINIEGKKGGSTFLNIPGLSTYYPDGLMGEKYRKIK